MPFLFGSTELSEHRRQLDIRRRGTSSKDGRFVNQHRRHRRMDFCSVLAAALLGKLHQATNSAYCNDFRRGAPAGMAVPDNRKKDLFKLVEVGPVSHYIVLEAQRARKSNGTDTDVHIHDGQMMPMVMGSFAAAVRVSGTFGNVG